MSLDKLLQIVIIMSNMIIIIIITSRPLYGGGSGVCVHFVYVYIGLYLVVLLWVSFNRLFLSLAQLWGPFGSLGQPLDHFGEPWVAMEVALGCLGAYSRFLTK